VVYQTLASIDFVNFFINILVPISDTVSSWGTIHALATVLTVAECLTPMDTIIVSLWICYLPE